LITVKLTAIGNSRTSSNEVHYKNLNFEIVSFVNTFENKTVLGFEQKGEQNAVLKTEHETQVYIQKSLDISNSGAIMTNLFGELPTWKYYSASDSTAVLLYRFMERVMFKAVYRNYSKFEGNIFNLYNDSHLITPLNTIVFDEVADKEFMITTIELDIRNEQAEFTAIEIRDTSSTDDFDKVPDVEPFRYQNTVGELFNKITEQKKPLDWKFGLLGVAVQLLIRGKRRRFNNYK